jgi:copper chaperone CopZ
VDVAPIDASSDLYRKLLDALRLQGDPDLPLLVKMRELKMLVLSANIRILPDFLWEKVVGAVRSQLLATFGFDQRALGQPVRVSEVITCIQNVRGVAYVDVDAFGSVSEQTTAPDGNRHLTTQDDIQDQVSTVVGSTTLANVITWCGGSDKHAKNLLRPAELAIFAPAVPATINLNQTP